MMIEDQGMHGWVSIEMHRNRRSDFDRAGRHARETTVKKNASSQGKEEFIRWVDGTQFRGLLGYTRRRLQQRPPTTAHRVVLNENTSS